jgi:hypothetical protein
MTQAQAYDLLARVVKELQSKGWKVKGTIELYYEKPEPSPLVSLVEKYLDPAMKAQIGTGNICPSCGSGNLKRTGACETCQECGEKSSCGLKEYLAKA